jgi:hypothetical protein
MGVRLTLIPVDDLNHPDATCSSFSLLNVDPDAVLFHAVHEVVEAWDSKLHKPLWTYIAIDGERYGKATTDPYGDRLRRVSARKLAAINLDELGTEVTKNHRAVWAYLAALEPDMPIVLWWW